MISVAFGQSKQTAILSAQSVALFRGSAAPSRVDAQDSITLRFGATKQQLMQKLLNAIQNKDVGTFQGIMDRTDWDLRNPSSEAEKALLHHICQYEAPPEWLLDLIQKKGADVNSRNYFGDTPLMKAGAPQIAKILIESGADINAQTKDSGETVLMRALQTANPQLISVVATLLEAGANVNAQDKAGKTPLMHVFLTATSKTKVVMELLLKHGADMTLKDKAGMTILDHGLKHLDFSSVLSAKDWTEFITFHPHYRQVADKFTDVSPETRVKYQMQYLNAYSEPLEGEGDEPPKTA